MAEEETKESIGLRKASISKQNYGANDTDEVASNVVVSLQPLADHSDSDDAGSNILLNLQPHLKDNDLEEKLLSFNNSNKVNNNDPKNRNKANKSKFRFADPSQLSTSPNPGKIIKKIEEQSFTQTVHGKCGTSNFVLDFQMDLGTAYPPKVRIINGIKSGKLSVVQRKGIKNVIWKTWTNQPYFESIKCCVKNQFLLMIIFGILIPIIIPMILLLADIASEVGPDLGLILILMPIMLGIIFWGSRWYTLYSGSFQFRARTLSQLVKYMDKKLRKQYPDLVFTLIYPIKMDGGVSPFTAIRKGLWCYLRVSEGIIDLDDFEPLYHRSGGMDDHEEDKLPEYNENCKLTASSEDFGDSISLKTVVKPGKYGNETSKIIKSVTKVLEHIKEI